MGEGFIDGKGVSFSDYRKLLPPRCSDWPFPVRLKNKELLATLHHDWDHCQVCGKREKIEIHHIEAGTKGRADIACNLISLCHLCHSWVKTKNLPQGLIYWCLWRTNRQSTDWVMSAILRRSFLPDLVIDNGLSARFHAERAKARSKHQYGPVVH